MADPFSDFGNLTVGVSPLTPTQQPLSPMGGGTPQQQQQQPMSPMGGTPQQQQPAQQQPLPPMQPADDPWGLMTTFQTPPPMQQPPSPVHQQPLQQQQQQQQASPAQMATVPAPAPAAAYDFAQPPAAAPPPPPPASDLPPGWQAYTDQASGRQYYAHTSGTVTWEKPAPVPQIMASPSQPQPSPLASPQAGNPFDIFEKGTAPAQPYDPFSSEHDGFFAVNSSHDSDEGSNSAAISVTTGSDSTLPKQDDDFWATMGFPVTVVEETPATPERAAVEKETKEEDPAADKETKEEDKAPAQAPAQTQAEDFRQRANRRRSTVRASVRHMPDQALAAVAEDNAGADALGADGLPRGKVYDTVLERHYAWRIGAVFQKAKQVKPNLYCKVSDKVIEALGSRPIVAYMCEGAAADSTGMQLGDILLAVNGQPTSDPKEALKMIETYPRPMTITMLRPKLPILVGENQHMVKHNNNKPRPPTHARDWTAKYVVVGGLVGKPHMMYLYHSKAQYDRAVAAVLSGRTPSVKIRPFDLRGCTVSSTDMVGYPGESGGPWHYFMVFPPKTANDKMGQPPNIVKISHPLQDGIIPVKESIKRVIAKYNTRPSPNVGAH